MKYRLFYLMIIGVLLFTVDGLGQNTWVKTFGGSQFEEGWSITSTTDGGYVLTGYTKSNDGDFNGMSKGSGDIFIMKLNSSGDTVWKKTYGGSGEEVGKSITTTTDGGFVLTGETTSNDGDFTGMNKGSGDIFIMKLNSNGDIVWKKTFGGSVDEWGNSITTTNDGGFVLTGLTSSNDGDFSGMNKGGSGIFNYDIFIMKLNSSGETVWKKIFGGSNNEEEGRSITTTTDGGYVLTGYTKSNDGDFSGMNKGYYDIFVMKLNSSGNTVWKKTFGGRDGDVGFSITTTTDGGFVLTGVTTSNDGDFTGMNKGSSDIFIMKLNSNGETEWKKTFGGSSNDGGWSITTTTDGGYVLTGYTYSNDGDFSGMNKGNRDIFVMKLDSNGNLHNTTSINEFGEPTTTLSVHPNPFHNSTTISYRVNTPSNIRIELLNTLGQTIEVLREDYTDIGTYQLPLNVSTLSSGMYSVRMRYGSMNEVVPVWVVR